MDNQRINGRDINKYNWDFVHKGLKVKKIILIIIISKYNIYIYKMKYININLLFILLIYKYVKRIKI